MANITLYGIPNCSSVKAARAWLEAHAYSYIFVDFKKVPPQTTQLDSWGKLFGHEKLLNRRGTTWRKLSATEQEQAHDEAGAIALMMQYPSLIKRPILCSPTQNILGFEELVYAEILRMEEQ